MENDVEQMTLSPEKLKRIIEFAETYRPIEPELVEALEITALQRAACQPFANIYAVASKQLRGSSHDRKNYLRSFLYYIQFEDSEDEDPDVYLKTYLTSYLPSNEEISPTLRAAILSVAWLQEAMAAISSLPDLSHRFGFFDVDDSNIRDCKKADPKKLCRINQGLSSQSRLLTSILRTG